METKGTCAHACAWVLCRYSLTGITGQLELKEMLTEVASNGERAPGQPLHVMYVMRIIFKEPAQSLMEAFAAGEAGTQKPMEV